MFWGDDPERCCGEGRWEGGSCLGTHVRIKDFKIRKKKISSIIDILTLKNLSSKWIIQSKTLDIQSLGEKFGLIMYIWESSQQNIAN